MAIAFPTILRLNSISVKNRPFFCFINLWRIEISIELKFIFGKGIKFGISFNMWKTESQFVLQCVLNAIFKEGLLVDWCLKLNEFYGSGSVVDDNDVCFYHKKVIGNFFVGVEMYRTDKYGMLCKKKNWFFKYEWKLQSWSLMLDLQHAQQMKGKNELVNENAIMLKSWMQFYTRHWNRFLNIFSVYCLCGCWHQMVSVQMC